LGGATMTARILVVDDDDSMRELIRIHLSSAGYQVTTAADAIEAGYQVLRNPPDLILTDVNMPHMDGFEFVAALKADKSVPDIPVIFLTSMEEGDARGKELGAVGYLTKPVRGDRLLSLVAKHVPGGAVPIG
jgi:two-component system chemotaxis response regulator CheY